MYYKAGEGPPLEELDDAWSAWFLWSQTDTWEPNTLGVQLSGVVNGFKFKWKPKLRLGEGLSRS